MENNTKAAKAAEEFLGAWRALEQACTEEGGIQVSQLEQNLESRSRQADASKLRICRQIRNFLVHDGQGFVSPDPAMLKFVTDMEKEVRMAKGTARDRMTSAQAYGQCTEGAPVKEAAALLLAKKRDCVIVKGSGGEFLGLLGARGLACALTDNKVKTVKPVILDAPSCAVPADTPVKDLPEGRALVMDGQKCAGVLNPKKGWQP